MTGISVLRMLRGTLGTAAAWAVTWATGGFVIGLVRRFFVAGENPTAWTPTVALKTALWSAADLAIFGAISGLVFATIVASRGPLRLPQLSLRRMAVWGAASALLLPVEGLLIELEKYVGMPGYVIERLITYGALGALCAAGTLALARRGRDGESLTAGEFRVPVAREKADVRDRRLSTLLDALQGKPPIDAGARRGAF